MRVLEVLEETLVLENPESTDDEIKKLQRFGISADNIDDYKKKSTLTKNWQTTSFSKDAWFLIFALSNSNRYAETRIGIIKKNFDYWYKKLVEQPKPDYSITFWLQQALALAKLQLVSSNAEDIVTELIGRVQNVLGITIGPAWQADGTSVKDVKEPYKDFYARFLQILGAAPQDYNFGKNPTDPVDQTDIDKEIPPYSVKEANQIAARLEDALDGAWSVSQLWNWSDDFDDDEVLSILLTIKSNTNWDLVQKSYKELYDEDLIEEIKDELGPKSIATLNKHLVGIKAKSLDPKSITSYSDKRDGYVVESPQELLKIIKGFEEYFFKQEPKYKKFAESKSGKSAHLAFSKNMLDEMKKQFKKDNRITVRDIKRIFAKHRDGFKKTADNLL